MEQSSIQNVGATALSRSHIEAIKEALWPHVGLFFIALLTTLPVLSVRFLPMFDYPHWVYQAHVLFKLDDFGDWYSVSWMPVPNLGSTIPMLILTPLFGAELGTRLLVACYVFAMVVAFGYLVRHLAGKPVAGEILGALVAYNYFFFNGFLSYILGVPAMLLTITLLHKLDTDNRKSLVLATTALSVITYLCHLFDWLPVFTFAVILMYFNKATRITILATQIPSLLLLSLYILTRGGGESDYQWYNSFSNKLFSLVGPSLPFQRVDPLSAVVPVLPLNIGFVLLVAWMFFLAGKTRVHRNLHKLLILLGFLGLVAVAMPFTWFKGMGMVDQRFSFTVTALGLALLASVVGNTLRRSAVTLIVLCTVTICGINFASYDQQLSAIHRGIQARESHEGAIVVSMTRPPLYGACQAGDYLNAGNGVFALRWFPLYDVVERGSIEAETFNTAALRPRDGVDFPIAFRQYQSATEARELVQEFQTSRSLYTSVIVFGCSNDLSEMKRLIEPHGTSISSGNNYIVIKLR